MILCVLAYNFFERFVRGNALKTASYGRLSGQSQKTERL